MFHWGLKTKVLILTLVPTLIIAVMLGSFFINTRLDELNETVKERGYLTIQKFLPVIHRQLAAGDFDSLQKISNRILEEADVRAVSIIGNSGRHLSHSGPTMWPKREDHVLSSLPNNPQMHATSDSLRFIVPVTRVDPLGLHLMPASHPSEINNLEFGSDIATSSDDFFVENSKRYLGWIELEISFVNTTIKKYQLAFASGLIVLIGLLINAFLALRMSKEVTEPLMKIISAVNRIKNGEFDTRVHTRSSGELHALETGINKMAETLKAGNEELQQSVDQATEDLRETLETIEIQNIELDLARKEALEGSRIKSEFLANMSHEIRTPLNGIVGFTNLLLKTALNSRQRDYLNTIQTSSASLLAIINDILDFSKIEAGKLVLDHVPFNLQEIIEEVLTMLAPLAHDKNLEQISLVYSDVPIHYIGDPLRIKQILINLVNNAIKFTETGNIILRVMLERSSDQKAVVKISVSDTGIGLSKEDQSAIFHAFSQADTSAARRFGGTGLGLVISKHLVKHMKGDIGLESELGLGSTFWFTVRLDINSHDVDVLDFQSLRGSRIGLFDSNPIAKLAVKHLLESWQINVIEIEQLDDVETQVSNASLDGNTLDCVLFGLHPNKIPDHDLPHIIESIGKQFNCRSLILAGTSEQTQEQIELERLAFAYIAKPICHNKLLNALTNLLAGPFSRKLMESAPLSLHFTEEKSPLTILAVDDNPANLKLLCALLEDLNIKVYSCNNGQQALNQVETIKFDLILMDIQMPVMDGIETTHHIRTLENPRQRTPIVAVTAHALSNEKQKLLRSGMDDYITKPISEKQLTHIIYKFTGVDLSSHIQETNQHSSYSESTTPQPTNQQATTSITNTAEFKLVDKQESLMLANGKQD